MIFSKVAGVRWVALGTIVLLAAAIGASAAFSGSGTASADGRPIVVATTTQAADLARGVGGSRVHVVGILAPNADPHEHEVRPTDVKALAGATLVVRSGGEVDGWLDDAIASAGSDAPVLTLLDHVTARRDRHGVDPHWWQDPRNGVRAVAALRDALAHAVPGGAAGFTRRADALTRRLEKLDAAVAGCLRRVPARQRKLVTTHDALGYYADRYGLRVIGAVIPSLSTQAQASAGDTARLVDTIRGEGVRAIFAESSVNAKVEEAIARETGARVGARLWADTLGPAGSDGATYLASIAANTRTIADGLSGGALHCRLPS